MADSKAKAEQGVLRAQRDPQKSSGRHIQWDEDNLAEHDKDRGTRQKIDEPPTPYVWSPAAMSEDDESGARSRSASAARPKAHSGVDPAEVAARLASLESASTEAAATASHSAAAPQAATADGTERGEGQEASSPSVKRTVVESTPGAQQVQVTIIDAANAPSRPASASFRAKRARHYDEFKAL
eukprot:CAMPEP_0178443892 /NCGR_PEP_ID=MMETSP0689_2-20121128/39166_1 /TAXON_ID=160604 /ORGANISM="Amphidinium massartii, Strain CS-259" /LENGTH=183 /DNA_ID=CAMNT_0020067987 /DNA_START=30 /DNA_END=578 /DNA_ORIENTATION=-